MGKASRARQQADRKARRAQQAAASMPANVEPTTRTSTTGLPDAWRELVHRLEVRQRTDKVRQNEIVRQALLAGVSYSEVARAVSISRQAAFYRYRNFRPAAEPTATAAAGGVDSSVEHKGWHEPPLFG